ncbi:MAG: prolipoprotein diacylglyceryl transferase [Ruminococcus sp.]|jgi:phosphatidylglycerol:prolipoprotein diacylglycerol transferase|nr:prolipoprotein diacylglyceryl transferase [Ruminococcus sp.]
MNADIIIFPALGWQFEINPDALIIGTFAVKWYAICIALGAILACLYCFPRIRKNGLDDDKAFDCTFWGFIGGIIGARLYYVIMTIGVIDWTFVKIINIREGGLAIYGGIIGAVAAAYIAGKIRKIRFIPLLDIAASGFFIGQCLGRWGNFFNHEAFGSNTSLPWGMTSGRIQSYIAQNAAMLVDKTGIYVNSTLPVHPTFLYESLWCLAGFLLLHFLYNRRKFDGECILFYAAWYGTGRAFFESLRTDSLMIGFFRVSQVLALVTAVAAFALIIIFHIRAVKNGVHLYKDSEEAKIETARAAERAEEISKRKAAKIAKEEILTDEQKIVDSDNDENEENDK